MKITDIFCEGGSRQKSPSRLGLAGSSGLKRLSTSVRKTPSKNQRRSPSRAGTPGRDGSTTPGAADRFIPNRSAMDFDTSHYKLTREVRLHIASISGGDRISLFLGDSGVLRYL